MKVTSNIVENLRAVKTPREIAAIRKGARIVDRIFAEIVPSLRVREGKGELSEAEIAAEIARLAKKFGADGMAFDPIVASGANAAAPHHLPGRDKIKKNNFLLLDFGVLVDGQHSDFTRTLFVGRPKKWQEKIYNTVLEAQLAGIEAIHNPSQPPLTLRGGVPPLRVRGGKGALRGGQVDKAIRQSIAAAGYGKYFTHSSGHGVGLEIHELPNLSPDSEDVLKPGMVVTVEPGIYIEGKGGVRVEDMVLIKEKGGEVMSKVGKEFKQMIVN